MQLLPSLLSGLKVVCATFPDTRKGRGGNIRSQTSAFRLSQCFSCRAHRFFYELEHNFGHGRKFLAMTLAGLNLLAFVPHIVLELLVPAWQVPREAACK